MNESNALDDLFQPFNRSDVPGLVVGVARHERRIYRRGFGLASIELGVANTPWTRMRIGSVSKHFTCLAALLLAEEGRLDIDAGVRSLLPDMPVPLGEPTLRQLMTHTSGYRCYVDLASLADGTAIQPPGAALAAQTRQRTANFAPGEKMIYSNGGYHLLSLIIERVAGMPFERFLEERIFVPLGMADTASVPSDFDIQPGMATLHVARPPDQGGGWRRGVFPTHELRGEGAMVSTIDDMLTWLAHLRAPDKRVGTPASWQQILTPATLNNGRVIPYGLGLFRHDYRGVEVIHHAGGVVGGTCQMLTVPADALDIVIITNGAAANPIDLGNRIIDALLGDGVLGAKPDKPAAERFRPMLGTRYHAAASGLVVGFMEAPEARLGLSFLDNPPAALTASGDALRLGFEDMAVGPLELRIGALAVEGQSPPGALTMSEGGHAERYERLPAVPPGLASVAAPLLGRYRAPDLAADAIMRLDGAQLLLDISGPHGRDLMTLEAFSDRVFGVRFSGEHPPMCGVLTVEWSPEGVTGLRVNTPRTRNLRFERVTD
jgi:CubicO group peptidase (beta-lactamase class C family)